MLSNTVKKRIADLIEKYNDCSCQFWGDLEYEAAAKVLRHHNPELFREPESPKQQQQVSTIDALALEIDRLKRSQPVSTYVAVLPQFKKIPPIV